MSNISEDIKRFFHFVVDKLSGKKDLSVNVTIKWLKERIRTLLSEENTARVAVMRLDKVIEECPAQNTLKELKAGGYDYVIATINTDGMVKDIEVLKNTSGGDPEVDDFLGDEGMVVVSN